MARKCVFCEREVPLTLEHVFPSWISSVLMPAESVVHIHRLEGEVVRAHTSAKMDATVKRVCERCNNGWMHELEEAARPVLTPLIRKTQPRGLAPIEQEVISTWAIKPPSCASSWTHGRQAPHAQRRDSCRSKRRVSARTWPTSCSTIRSRGEKIAVMAARYARTPTGRNLDWPDESYAPALDVLGIDTEKLRSEGRLGVGLHLPLAGDMHPARESGLSG